MRCARSLGAGGGVRRLDAQFGGESGQSLHPGQLLVPAGVGPGDLPDQGPARHGKEAHLAGAAGPAAVQPAAQDQRGAQALLVPQQDEVLVAAGCAEPLFGDGGEIDVVLVLDGHRQGRRQLLQEGGECQPGRWLA